eukprot:PhM_4_TR16796/c2_g1_i10/m.97651
MCRGGPVAVRRRRSGLTTSSVKRTYLNRSCVWNERLEIRAPWELDNSEGMSCIPDIIVTLMDGNDYVAYKRVPASDVMGSTGSSEQTLFLVPFAEPDDARDKDTGLIGCRMRITHTAPKSLQHRMPADTQSHKNQKPVTASPITVKGAEALTLRAHIYKARNLPAGDDNGLSDPYVRVVFGGGCGQTNFLTNKVNPSFNECVEFDVDAFSPYPPLVVEAWDHDIGSCSVGLAALMQSTRGIDFYDEESEEDEEHLDHAEDFDSEIDNKDRSLKASMSPRSGSSVKNYGSTEMSGPVLEPDDDDDNISPWLRAYFKGKIPRYPTNLERQYLGFKDRFLDYPLTRGTSSNTVGCFKGRIHVATATNEPVPPVAATTPLESARVIVNVYVLRASSLIPHTALTDTALTGG